MPAPTNPKKKSLMPSGPLRRALRAAGHHLSPVVQVGKEGVTPAVLRQLDEALLAHELVKVKIGTETPEDRFEAAEALGEGAQIAQILGRTILVYRRHPDHPRFEAAPARRADDDAPAPARRRAGKAKPRGKPAARAAPPGRKPARTSAGRGGKSPQGKPSRGAPRGAARTGPRAGQRRRDR